MKFWTRAEVERLLLETGLAAKAGAVHRRARSARDPAEAGRAECRSRSRARRQPRSCGSAPNAPRRRPGRVVHRLQPGAAGVRALVTGGGGFLGSRLVERLEADGHDVFAARRRDYDLTTMDAAARLFEDARPELVFHLAAEVGGIGANRANPGRYWYANLMMGAHVLEQSRAARGREARDRRHRLLLPEVHAGAVQRGRALERLPGGDERALRRRQEGGADRRTGLPRPVRPASRPTCCRPTSTGRATTSTRRTRT